MALVELKFLGWDCPPLTTACTWLIEHLGPDLSGYTVALPGSRAVRSLRLALLREGQQRGVNVHAPDIVTIGSLTDRLVGGEGRVASGLVRRLCWEQALAEASHEDRFSLSGSKATEGLVGLATQLRGLHADLVAASLDVDQVLKAECIRTRPLEARRWQAVGQLQNAYRKILEKLDLVDPHDRRRLALEHPSSEALNVILIGIASREPLRAAALKQSTGTVQHLVFAPESIKDLFDDQGCVLPKEWPLRKHVIPAEKWLVVPDPKAQAERVLGIISDSQVTNDSEVSIGIVDGDAVPDLVAALAKDHVDARDAGGQSAGQSLEGSLIRLLADFFQERDTSTLAGLWRHPWIECRVQGDDSEGRGILADLDSYLSEHLPRKLGEPWLTNGYVRSGERNTRLEKAQGVTDQLLSPLTKADGVAAVCSAARDLIGVLIGDQELDQEDPIQRRQVSSLRALGATLNEIEELPKGLSLAGEVPKVLRRVSEELAGRVIPPSPLDGNEPAVDLLGWLELLFDPAPLLVVTSVVEGALPDTSAPDSILPELLRRELGLECQDDRFARDLFTAEVLDHSRDTYWITPRSTTSGDPLLPSRLMLRVPPADLPAHLRRWIDGGKVLPVRGLTPPRPVPRTRLVQPESQDVYSVTGFRAWLDAPYLYHLERELKLSSLDDRNHEVTASGFGNLVHKALEILVAPELCGCTEAAEVEFALHDALADEALKMFGHQPVPAVQIQIEQARHRLSHFSHVHVERTRKGWRVTHAEWEPEDGGQVPMAPSSGPASLKGRIDRIERHEDGRWALWDYKTGSTKKSPNAVHRAKGDDDNPGAWRDLQLPLYAHLAQGLIGEAVPELGYMWLGKDSKETASMALKCDAVYLAEAHDKACEIIDEVRAGGCPEPKSGFKPFTDMSSFLIGHGLALSGEDES